MPDTDQELAGTPAATQGNREETSVSSMDGSNASQKQFQHSRPEKMSSIAASTLPPVMLNALKFC